jgi:putative phosphotransacetylase
MEKKVLVETSARHVHLTKEAIATLFGEGYELTPKKMLSQPGQFACEERVTIVGPRGEIKNVRALGLTPPVRESGDLVDSASCKIIGPKGEIEIPEGVIIAKRHIHLTPADAEAFGVKDMDVVSVRIKSEDRSLVFEDVVCRVSPNYSLAMHIDTDESNAAHATGEIYGEVITD